MASNQTRVIMKKYIMGILLITLYSCSNLRVQVSTANPESLKKIAGKINPMEKLAFQYKKALQPLLGLKIITEKDNIIKQFDDNLKTEVTTGISDQATADIVKSTFNQNYTAVVDGILSDYNTANTKMVNKLYKDAVDIYLGMPQKFQTLKSNLSIEEVLKPEQKEAIINEIATKLSVVTAIFHNGRANLLGDEIVSYITMKENDTIWKSTYNRTASRTYFGNADIAVVLNEMPNNYNNNYSIKGVRVDAAKLIQSTLDVMTQVVNVAASMSGVLPANKGDANSFYPDEFDEIKSLPVKSVELQNRKDLLKETQKQLLLKILGEHMQNESGTDLKNSVAGIKAFWDEYKVNLSPNSTTP